MRERHRAQTEGSDRRRSVRGTELGEKGMRERHRARTEGSDRRRSVRGTGEKGVRERHRPKALTEEGASEAHT